MKAIIISVILIMLVGCIPYGYVPKNEYRTPQRIQPVQPVQPYIQQIPIQKRNGVTVISFKVVIDETGKQVKGE